MIRLINQKFLDSMSCKWDTKFSIQICSYIERRSFDRIAGHKLLDNRIAFECIGTVKMDMEDEQPVFYMTIMRRNAIPNPLTTRYIKLIDSSDGWKIITCDEGTFRELGIIKGD